MTRATRRQRRIERLEIATGTHDVFGASFACPVCGINVTKQVRRKMLDGGRFTDNIVGICSNGHYAEYQLNLGSGVTGAQPSGGDANRTGANHRVPTDAPQTRPPATEPRQ